MTVAKVPEAFRVLGLVKEANGNCRLEAYSNLGLDTLIMGFVFT